MVATRGQRRREREQLQEATRRSVRDRGRRDNFWDQVSERGWRDMLENARRQAFPKTYRPTDIYHRHRLEDRQDKDVHVSSYTRRA